MSTRSLTVLPGRDGETAVMYRHSDGYPSGHGRELAEFLVRKTITDGIPYRRDGHDFTDAERALTFNGPEDLAAALVTHFKNAVDGPGEVYLYPAGTRDMGEEYVYTITLTTNDRIVIVVHDYEGNKLFVGFPNQMLDVFLAARS